MFPEVVPVQGVKYELEEEAHTSTQDHAVDVEIPGPIGFGDSALALAMRVTPRHRRMARFLKRQGFVYPWRMIRAAHRVKIRMAVACAMVTMETGNGRSVWGHDPVDTHGCYSKGGSVTRENYHCYKQHRGGGSSARNMQGCSSTQLTYWSFQDRADSIGGCWHPYYNMVVGFATFAAYRKAGATVREAAKQYNGSWSYADQFEDWVEEWQRRFKEAGF